MRSIIAATLLMAAVLPVAAADMADPPPVLRGALPSGGGIDFTGFYAGGLAGYNGQVFGSRHGLSASAVSNIQPTVYGTVGQAHVLSLPQSTSTGRMGFGVFAGYNWGFDEYIIGVEADYVRARLRNNTSASRSGEFEDPASAGIPGPGQSYQYAYTTRVNSKTEVTDYGTIRARFGMPMGQVMPFATAGLAWARTSHSIEGTLDGRRRAIPTGNPPAGSAGYAADPSAPASVYAGAGMRMIYGYALGAGVDWALSSNIMLRAELMTMRFTDWAGGVSKANIGFQNQVTGVGNADNTMSINTARVGAAVKF
jgi:outer membrane immunogenic protein